MSFIETKDLRLIYFDPLGYLVPHVQQTFSNSLAWQRRMLGWVPSEPTTVLLKDFADYGGGTVNTAPRDRMTLEVSPLSHAFETFPASDRFYTEMNHELIHVVQGDLANEQDRRWRSVFRGKIWPQSEHPETLLYSAITIPRFTAPRWYIEGGAVFFETWMSGGLGRAQGGYDEMVFRAMVRDDQRFPDPFGVESGEAPGDFQGVANAYLYGTRFITWLAYVYSPEKVVAWFRRDEASERNYADQFRKVFGLPLEQAWKDWVGFEHDFQRRNLEEVRKHPITREQRLTDHALGSISKVYFDESSGILYGGFRYAGVNDHIGAVNTRDGSVRVLADIKKGMLFKVASFAFDPESNTAFYTNDNLAMRDLMSVNVKTGEERILLKDARIGEIVLNPVDRSLVGVRHANGLAVLVSIAPPYDQWKPIYVFPYGVVPYDLDISPDGRLLSASMSSVGGDQYLRVFELAKIMAGSVQPLSEFKFGQSVPESFTFSRDGRYLYGSSYYTGVSNIFRYEVATGDVEAVSNAESGLFRPVPLSDGRLLVLTFTNRGFVPAIIEPRVVKDLSAIHFLGAELAREYPVVTEWQVDLPSAEAGRDEKNILKSGPYRPGEHLALDNAFPVMTGFWNDVGIGYQFNFADPIGFERLGINLGFTPYRSEPQDERFHAQVRWQYLGWHADLAWNRTDFYDLFGPTKVSRKGLAAKFGHDEYLIFDDPRRLTLSGDAAYYARIDRLPWAQSVTTSFDEMGTVSAALQYADVRQSRGAVDDEKGLAWSARLGAIYADGVIIPQLLGTLDVGFPVPLPHSSIWLRTAAGLSTSNPENPAASYYFGAFGNNFVDGGAVKRYREPFSFPGFGIDAISAQRFVRPMLEWNLPPLGFQSAGIPAFHATWVRPSVFASAMWTATRGPTAGSERYANAGAQVDLRFSVLHWHEMTLSAGFAVGLQGGRQISNEWMLSLKFL